MARLADLIDQWNAFMPLLPVTLDVELLWIALPLALIAFLFLRVYAHARRLAQFGRARVGLAAGAKARRFPPSPGLRTVLARLTALLPRAPASPRVAESA